MSHFINARAALVGEAIDGLLAASGGRLARLDGDPDIRVVVRADWTRDAVAVISGGGSGHEPAHAGFVGPGLLTAAVCGDVFASPSADAVLAAILAVTGEAGCLLIIKNYAGDRLNFGLAAERARALGYRVETVVVADDVAIADAAQPRGIAGTLFVHKVAGGTAADGGDLDAVAGIARRAAGRTKSLGIALSTCTLPGREAASRFGDGEAELGLGIHGEPGIERIKLPPAQEVAALIADRLSAHVAADTPLALLANNLGATTALEMEILTAAMLATPLGRRVRLLHGPAATMTALDMHGASFSVVELDDAIERLLRAPTEVAAWPAGTTPTPATLVPIPKALASQDELDGLKDPAIRGGIDAVCNALVAAESELNALDTKVGDGDTGTTFADAARAVLKVLDALPTGQPDLLCDALSRRIGRAVGGSSGVLMSIFFAAAAGAHAADEDWSAAVARGIERMTVHGGAAEGDRTMLDALIPAAAALTQGGVAEAASAARRGADATASMRTARSGRSAYLNADSLAGNPDPGAVAVAIGFEALARG